MKKLLTWVLALVLCAMPLSGLAEETMQGRLYTLSIGNVSFALNGAPAQTIGATLNLKGGMKEDGRFLFGVDAQGGDAVIGRFTLTGDEENLLAYLDGMSSAYGITVEQMQQIMAESGQGSASEMPDNFDMEALKGMIEGYVGLLMDVSDPEKLAQMQSEELQDQIMTLYGVDPKAEPASEQVTVLGESLTLSRYDMSMNIKDVDALYEVLGAANENMNKFWTNYKKFAATAMGMEADSFSLSALMAEAGMDMTMDMTLWADEADEWAKIDMKINMTVTDGGETRTVVMPYLIEVHEKDELMKMSMTMDMSEIDAGMRMNMDAVEEGGVVTLKMDMDMEVEGETMSMAMDFAKDKSREDEQKLSGTMAMNADGEQVNIAVDGTYQLAEDGAEEMSGNLTVEANGEKVAILALNYAGAIAKGEGLYQRGGRLTFSANAMGETLEIGADLNYKHEPLTDEAFAAIEALPQIGFSQVMEDEQAQQQAMVELQTAMITAMGAVMQTPGVAELVAQTMTAMESAAQEGYEDYGYGDYGYGYGGHHEEPYGEYQHHQGEAMPEAPIAA